MPLARLGSRRAEADLGHVNSAKPQLLLIFLVLFQLDAAFRLSTIGSLWVLKGACFVGLTGNNWQQPPRRGPSFLRNFRYLYYLASLSRRLHNSMSSVRTFNSL